MNLKELEVFDAFMNGTSGSKVVITCRDRAILSDYMSEEQKILVDELNDEQAKLLFSHYAFHGMDTGERYTCEEQAEHIVKACAGLPLSIEVIGQHLRRQNHLCEDERMDMWKEALWRLKNAVAFEGHDNDDEKLWAKLKISYDDLGELEKGFFLDFACILCHVKDMDKNTVVRIWNSCGGLQTLINSLLIKVVRMPSTFWYSTGMLFEELKNMGSSPYNMKEVLVMHDQLQDMGRWIVRGLGKKESGRHVTHMLESSEFQNFILDNESISTLEGLSVVGRVWHDKSGSHRIPQYPRLRLLNLSSNGGIVVKYVLKICGLNPQNLRWLCLDNSRITVKHLKTLDANFKGLCVLRMRCLRLDELPSSIGELSSLWELDLRHCEHLSSLPDAIGRLENLQVLILYNCNALRVLPASIGNLSKLLDLDLSFCRSLISLPETLGELRALKVLNLSNCHELKEIPAEVGQLIKLESLDLGGCHSLQTLCEFDKRMHHLHTLDLSDCSILKSFKFLGNLYRLQRLNLHNCCELCVPNLPECLGQLSQLQYFNLSGCRNLTEGIKETLRKGLLCADRLEAFLLSSFVVEALPSCPRLKLLDIIAHESCSVSLGNLRQLQVLSVKYFPWCTCTSLPESLGNLTQLQELYLVGNFDLSDSLSKLVGLKLLHIGGSNLQRLPELLSHLKLLHTLELGSLAESSDLPLSLGHLPQLRSLRLYSDEFELPPEIFAGLSQLRSLSLFYYLYLVRLPESLATLTQLSELDLHYCSSLQWKEDGQLTILKQLHERGCQITLPDGSWMR